MSRLDRLIAALERIATALEQLAPALTQATRQFHPGGIVPRSSQFEVPAGTEIVPRKGL